MEAEVPAPSHSFHKRSARARREQRQRSEARMAQKLVASFQQLCTHRGSQPSRLGQALHYALAVSQQPQHSSLCRHFAAGNCTYGGQCKFSHQWPDSNASCQSTFNADANEFVPGGTQLDVPQDHSHATVFGDTQLKQDGPGVHPDIAVESTLAKAELTHLPLSTHLENDPEEQPIAADVNMDTMESGPASATSDTVMDRGSVPPPKPLHEVIWKTHMALAMNSNPTHVDEVNVKYHSLFGHECPVHPHGYAGVASLMEAHTDFFHVLGQFVSTRYPHGIQRQEVRDILDRKIQATAPSLENDVLSDQPIRAQIALWMNSQSSLDLDNDQDMVEYERIDEIIDKLRSKLDLAN